MIGNHENQIISIAPPLSHCLPPFFLQSTTCHELQEINTIVNDSGKRETSDTNQSQKLGPKRMKEIGYINREKGNKHDWNPTRICWLNWQMWLHKGEYLAEENDVVVDMAMIDVLEEETEGIEVSGMVQEDGEVLEPLPASEWKGGFNDDIGGGFDDGFGWDMNGMECL